MTGGAHGPVRIVTAGGRAAAGGPCPAGPRARRTGRTGPSCAPTGPQSPARTRDTPSAPPVASPQMAGRPTKTAVAPSASAVSDVRARPDPAVGVDLDLVADGVARPRAGRPRWRPPGRPAGRRGSDTHDRRRAGLDARAASSPRSTPFTTTGQAGELGEPADVVEGPGRAASARGCRRAGLPSGRSGGQRGSAFASSRSRRPRTGRSTVSTSAPVAGLPGPAGEVVGVRGGVQAVELEPLRGAAGSAAATSASGVLADVDTVISAPAAAAPRARSPLAVRDAPCAW